MATTDGHGEGDGLAAAGAAPAEDVAAGEGHRDGCGLDGQWRVALSRCESGGHRRGNAELGEGVRNCRVRQALGSGRALRLFVAHRRRRLMTSARRTALGRAG